VVGAGGGWASAPPVPLLGRERRGGCLGFLPNKYFEINFPNLSYIYLKLTNMKLPYTQPLETNSSMNMLPNFTK
jgi:hypothetical protein